ncbi:nonribosomal peptide synthetase-like protein 2 [Massarina eburnea CBS 473.64]|uniref:Nonribosomal peptide synthetase-like protein 2 n=1 Tax=Massarina eburnea CBS 473.64 TaxID=1395130 RepID=A0A6A6S9S7_9PLEO|nr:nonribosomal peptide synthetase-like protein 2 [Massarina eburnea CBS 473.64]
MDFEEGLARSGIHQMLLEPRPIPKLSILNRHPKSLEGPRLLHGLVQPPSNSPAIEFLEDLDSDLEPQQSSSGGVTVHVAPKTRVLTYDELHVESNALARKINRAGLGDGSPIVPVFLPQSPELYIALLAILKAGRAFCPIGLDVPKERLDFILNDVSAELVVTNLKYADRFSACSSLQVLLVDKDLSDQDEIPYPIAPSSNPTNLAYVIYTSGSTGLPKAVSVSHRAVTQSLLAHDRHIPNFSRFLQFAAPTFDVSVFEIFFPLYRGCTLVGCTRSRLLDDLPGIITSLNVDAAELTPTVVDNLLRKRSSVPGLKLLLTIGEMLTKHVVNEFGGQSPEDSILWGMYGPTEAAIHCTLQPSFTRNFPVGNVGFPLDTVSTFIAAPASEKGSTMSVLPIGTIGELVIGGPQVAEGYLNRPDITETAFFTDPEFGYLYRTGDKARLNQDGSLECLGRIVSGQVKLRGQRVELAEIEQTVLKAEVCHSAVVVVIEGTLVAFCADQSGNASSNVILDTCKRLLPSYMVPSEAVIVKNMPQLPSGKIDKRALEEQFLRSSHHSGYSTTPPNGETEARLMNIIRRALGHTVHGDARLDISGIDSLRAILVASALREQGYNITALEILSAKTLAELIRMCGDKSTTKAVLTEIADVARIPVAKFPELKDVEYEIQDILPCTPLQEAMLVETNTKPSAYCNWIEVELHEPLSFSLIREYLVRLASRNEIIRSGFVTSTSGSGSFATVIWKSLAHSAITEVAKFSRSYSLGSTESLLRPFAVQVVSGPRKPRLLFQIHHSLYDGWSFDLLMHDLNQLILNLTPTDRPQYRNIVQYYLTLPEEDLSKAKTYWANVLHESSPTPLPNFNGRVVRSNGLASVRGESSIDAQSLYAHATDLSINPQVLFQAAIAYIVSLYVGSSDVVIGTVTSGRTIPVTRIEEIIGPCIYSLPYRLKMSETPTVRDVLKQTQKANRDMLEHCLLPLRDIIKLCELRPGERLFDVLFVWQQSMLSHDEATRTLKVVDSADDSEFKVILEFEPRDDRILYRITYDPSNVPEQQAIYLSSQIDQVVNYFLSHLDDQMSEVADCFHSETISIANPNPQQTYFQNGLSHAVENWAMEAPHKDAVVFGGIVDGVMEVQETLTFASLNSRANQLATTLIDHGAGDDRLICIFLDKSIDLYISILAVLKVGCGYLPITPDTPPDRTKRIMVDAEVELCVSHSSVSGNIPHGASKVLELDKLDLLHCSDRNLEIPYNGSHLAYAIFTSGSTGKPKGVLVTQDNLMSNIDYLSSLYPTTSDSRMLQSCSHSFDVSVFEIFFSWYVGMCICTATKEDLFYDFESAIDSLRITHLSLTPTVAGLIDPGRVPKVKFLVTAGEALTENVRRKWAGHGLFQGYGPSETTNICTVRPYVTSDDLINNIGKPFLNTLALVLAPGKDHILPRGAVGELCFGGSQVFRGYLKAPELNAEKLFVHPEYGRIYRSGDMGLLLPDDSILSTGRMDDQVKIRGQRVELGEITSILLDLPSVMDCATLLLRHEHGAQILVCFWVPSKALINTFDILSPAEFRSTIMDLYETLSVQLPLYMVPSHLVPITHIPMTPQAKIDKRLLRSAFENLVVDWLELTTPIRIEDGAVEELSTSEQEIVEVLARTLSIDAKDVRHAQSFFNLGVDSVSAIRFAQGLRNAGFNQVSVSTILKNPFVKRLSSVITKQSAQQPLATERLLSISDIFSANWVSQIQTQCQNRGEEVEKILPCTPLQEAMLAGASPSEASYCNTMIFAVHGRLDHLKRCWEHMFARHEVLRTAFIATDDERYAFAQIVLAPKELQWDIVEIGNDPMTSFRELLPHLVANHLPPVRMGIQQTVASTKLIFSCHHALYDGTAISTLLDEVQELYSDHELPPPVTYDRYLQHMANQNFATAENFWAASLDGLEPKFFPNVTNRVLKPIAQNFSIERALQTSLTHAIEFCRSSSTSLLSLVQASWAKMLHFYIGESDFCFGNVVSGRTLLEEDLERLVAPCFNTIPIRLNFDFRKSNAELCRELHDSNIECIPFQLTPLRWIQSKVLKDQGRLFDTLVILQQPITPLDPSIWSLEQDVGDMDLPVVCEVFQDERDDTLRLVLHFSNSLLSERDADFLAQSFDIALQSLTRSPNSAANDTLDFPSQLLSQSNMNWTSFESPQGGLLHSAFEVNAKEYPGTVALDFWHENGERTILTFSELNGRANQVAHALIQYGIRTEDIVPVHMSKCPQFYISILGILKAGAAFAPIHPDLPEARKSFMLSELRPKLILCLGILDWSKATPTLNFNSIDKFSTETPTDRHIYPTNLAYCLYTSGSTGDPKAVSIEHRAPIQTIQSSRSLIPWAQNSRLLQYAAITFDMCYYDCFLAWSFGFTLCAADQATMLNNLPDSINNLNVDLLDLTPSVAASLRRTEIPNVKWLYCIGEAMSTEVVHEWNGSCVNSYGPTEAAFCTTIFPVTEELKTSIIGKPFPTTSFAVFPPDGDRPLPILGVGELYIGGAQIAREYFNKTEMTEEKFVQKCGQRFYKTGDMVRMLTDGNFEFLGRADDQVKIRGLRVELGEISHVLQDCNEHISAVTTQILRQKVDSKDQLVAFMVTSLRLSEEERLELRRKARQAAMNRLPAYMVPHFFVFVDYIPKSMAGKIDKKALEHIFRDSDAVRSGPHDDTDASTYAWSRTESRIREIFSKLSKSSIDEILPWTTIYQLGLDSISAVQIATALRKQGLHASAADVMHRLTCQDLAAYIEEGPAAQATIEQFNFDAFETRHKVDIMKECNIKDGDVEAILPCTPLQSGILSQFLAKDGGIYFNYLRLRLDADVDLKRMRNAWSIVMEKHPMLRTGFFHAKDNRIPFAMVQYHKEAIQIHWDDNIDHASSTIDQWLEESRQQAIKQLHRPPWRVRVFKEDREVCLDLALLHAIFDAQSLRLILNDITAAYNGESIGKAMPLDPIITHIIHSGLSTTTGSIEFWKQLGKSAAPNRFPNLAPLRYEPLPSEVVTKFASKSLTELDTGCRRVNTSLQVVAMASWATLLASYTGQELATFGVVLSGRNFEGADSAVFPCITTVPFACKMSDSREDNLQKVMSLNTELHKHQFTPLGEIQKLMEHPNEQLFDSIFAFQKLSTNGSNQDPWAIVDERATTEYSISIELERKDTQLEYRLTYLPHMVPREQAILILEQLDHFLQHYIFPISADQRPFDPQLYSITPAKEANLPSETRLLHEMVEATASKLPSRIALEFAISLRNGSYESRKWTYAELDAEGNRVAHLLLAHNVHVGEMVGICMDKCPEASFAILGILKAGCAFVALDPGAPTARKAFIIKDSGAKIVLSMSPQSANMKENVKATILNLDQVDIRSMPSGAPLLERGINTQDRSYCLYTSGTTGTPKGCELTHENAVQAMLAFERLFTGHWNNDSRWLQFASFHFDVSVLEQYWSWYVGICVVSAPRDLIFEDLAASIRTLGITHIDLTPSLARILHPDDVPSLCKGVFITGGETLKQEILDVWGPAGVIYNGYGPTEATIGVTMYPRVPANGKPSNIGMQFDNVGSYILCPGLDVPVLRGGVGELCVSGKLVGKGYLNRPDLTKTAFPTLQRFGERVYRTGDLARILHDGTFEFLGRADDQVKLRGQRLEIGEINTVIKQSSMEVKDATTLVLKHPKQQKEQLVAFVAIGSDTRRQSRIQLEMTNELIAAKRACQEKLPPYMVPTHFVALTTMPLNVNNKADARRLYEMYGQLSIADLQTVSSVYKTQDGKWSKQEEKIRNVLEDVLKIGVNDINKDANFFELGMDSISVIGVSRAIKCVGFSKATASVVIKNATIRQLAKVLSEKSSDMRDRGSIITAQQAITAIQHRHRRDVAESLFMDARNIEALAPCTPLQQGMIARSFESENGLYFNSFCCQLTEEVNLNRLHGAWEKVFQSTQILRTVFINTEDGFVQAELRKASLRFDHVSLDSEHALQEISKKKRMEWIQRNQSIIKMPFELTLFETPERKMLVIHIFHALYDGISIELILKKVWDTYNGGNIQTGPSFQSALAHGPLRHVNGAREFWEKHLISKTFTPLPIMTENPTAGAVSISKTIRNLTNLEPTRRKLNVTAQTISQACWTSVLHQYTKSTVTVGLVVSGRSIDFEGADEINGPLFNTIPYQYHPRHCETWATMIKGAHNFNTAAHPFQHTPLRDIMKWSKRNADQALFDTLFVYQVANRDTSWVKNDVWELDNGGVEADYPLAMEVEQRSSDELEITLVTQGYVVDKEKAQEMLDHFERALQEAICNPDTTVEIMVEGGNDGNDFSMSNGDPSIRDTLDGTADFQWTANAIILKEEIARLADTDLDDINETTSIFELGLDSIDAIKLSSKLNKRGIVIPVSGIMRSLSISNMLQHIATGKKKKDERPSAMIYQSYKRRLENCLMRRGLTEDIEKILAPTPLQEAMVAEMVASDYTRYYNHDVLKLGFDTDIEKLQTAFTDVVRQSPILRTSFIQVDDPGIDSPFAQIVHREPHAFWGVTEVGEEFNLSTIFEEIRQRAIESSNTVPLFHIRLVRSPEQTYLVLSIAHALYDGWSLGLIHQDVHRAYDGRLKPRPNCEPTLLQILTTSGSDAVAFWRDYLSDATPSKFPRRTKSVETNTPIVHRRERSSHIALQDVVLCAKKNNISLQALGQTVYGLAMAWYNQTMDVTFGSVLSGRDDDERSQLLFPTMNTVAIRAILHGTRRDMLQYVQDNFSNIKQWQHFPLRKALSLAKTQGVLFETLFIYQKSLHSSREGTRLYESIEGQSNVEYLVCVEMEVVGQELVWRCAVKDDVLDENGANRLLDRLDEVLENIINRPDAATIDFTAQGISICDLPAFEDELAQDDGLEDPEEKRIDTGKANTGTISTINEVLEFVSKIAKEDITEDMTIFHIGLDSISAIKVSSLLRKRGIILSVGEMLKAGTVERMAKIVDARSAEPDQKDTDLAMDEALTGIDRAAILEWAGIEEENIDMMLPATAGQTYMVSMWLNTKGATFYPDFTYDVHGPIDFDALQTAWKALIDANPILRTSLYATNDRCIPYVQIVQRQTKSIVQDITESSLDDIARVLGQCGTQQPFVHLFASRAPQGWSLRLKIHHALYDGVSLPILMQQLQDICNRKAVPSLPNLFPRFIASSFVSPNSDTRKLFWTKYFGDMKQQTLPQPQTTPKSKVEIFKPGLISEVGRLDTIARKHGITTQSLFLAVYTRLHARLTSTPSDRDVVIGIYLANRSLPIPNLVQATIPTLNLVPLRVSMPLEADTLDVAAQIQYDMQEISSAENAGVALWEIQEWCDVRVDCWVNFLKLPNSEGDKGDAEECVKIFPSQRWSEAVAGVVEMTTTEFSAPEEMVNKRVNETYPHSIDVEATIRNNSLDVGIFAPQEMLGLPDSERLMEDIKLELLELMGGL